MIVFDYKNNSNDSSLVDFGVRRSFWSKNKLEY